MESREKRNGTWQLLNRDRNVPISSTILSNSFIISARFIDLLRDAIVAEASTEVPVEESAAAAAADTNAISERLDQALTACPSLWPPISSHLL